MFINLTSLNFLQHIQTKLCDNDQSNEFLAQYSDMFIEYPLDLTLL